MQRPSKEHAFDWRNWTISTLAILSAPAVFASNHREAPITALDHKADITDLYAFVSYSKGQQPAEEPSKVTFVLCVDPLQEPGNGPTWFPFDPDILYTINVDNDRDAMADVVFHFRFQTELQTPSLYTALAGVGDAGATDPETGNLVVPPRIQDFYNPGLNLRQTYNVYVKRRSKSYRKWITTQLADQGGQPFFAVPSNAGPRTIDYESLFDQATYTQLNIHGVSVFAGTVDDPFFIDLGAAFDTANFRTLSSGVPGVLTEREDLSDRNFASDTVSGYSVNAIAIEVPIHALTRTGMVEPSTSPDSVIGVWASTSRPKIRVLLPPEEPLNLGHYRQVQRFGNPLINELIIGIGSKNRFSMDRPKNDKQFADFFLNPPIAQAVEALYNELAPGALDVPEGPRTDLLPLVQYVPPIATDSDNPGPIADLMRLNTGVPATPVASASRLGLIDGDPAGFPNGRRLFDDVVDITLRVGVGGILNPDFNKFPNNVLGDGVNVNDARLRQTFPYVANAPSGRNRRHVDPGEEFPGGGTVPVL